MKTFAPENYYYSPERGRIPRETVPARDDSLDINNLQLKEKGYDRMRRIMFSEIVMQAAYAIQFTEFAQQKVVL